MPKGHRLTTDLAIQQFKEVHGNRYDYSNVDFKHNQTKVIIICQIHGRFEQTPQSHKKGHGCVKCANENKTLSHEHYVSKLEKVTHTNLKAIEEYKTQTVSILHLCLDCGYEFKVSPHSILQKKTGCSACYHSKARFTDAEYKNRLRSATEGKIRNLEPYKNIRTKIEHQCNVCENIWKTKPHNILICNTGCPKCSSNLMCEPLFREVLEQMMPMIGDFKFPNVRPDWLRNPETNCKLELDCYNEELELAFELQGTHHYEPIKAWGGESKLSKTICRDNHKVTECRKQGIELFRIDNRPAIRKPPHEKRKYYENEIRKCLTKLPEHVKLKLLNANK